MNTLQKIALFFTILGALNWGLIGLFNFNFVTSIFGQDNFMTTLIYIVIGVAGLINILLLFVDNDRDSI